MSALRLLIGYGGMEAQDEIPGAIVIPQGYIIVLSNGPHQRDRVTSAPDPQNHAAELHPSGATSKQTVQYRLANMGRNELQSLLLNRWAGLNPVGRPSEAQPVHPKQQITTTTRVMCMCAHSENQIQLETS